jgi:hypothetical protein
MQRSDQFGDIAAALAKAQKAFTVVPKNKTATVKTKTGGEYKYKYADLADVLSMALPHLAENNIAFLQPHILAGGKLRVCTMLMHPSGQWLQSDGIEISEDGDPQQMGAESTYFRRYDACTLLGVAPDEDTDAQQAGARLPRVTSKPIAPAPASAPAHASQEPGMYDPVEQAAPPSVRSTFLQKAKDLGWGMGETRKYLAKLFPDAKSTAGLTEKQLSDTLEAFAGVKPEEFFAEPTLQSESQEASA